MGCVTILVLNVTPAMDDKLPLWFPYLHDLARLWICAFTDVHTSTCGKWHGDGVCVLEHDNWALKCTLGLHCLTGGGGVGGVGWGGGVELHPLCEQNKTFPNCLTTPDPPICMENNAENNKKLALIIKGLTFFKCHQGRPKSLGKKLAPTSTSSPPLLKSNGESLSLTLIGMTPWWWLVTAPS